MPTSCRFVFTRATPTYYSGEQMCGSICLTTTKQLLGLEAIKLKFIGFCRVDWHERCSSAAASYIEHNDARTHSANDVHYSGYRKFHTDTQVLSERATLAPGTFTVDFCCGIPALSAASCKQRYGEVGYILQLIVRRKTRHNKVFTQPVLVRSRLDLRAELAFSPAQTRTTHKEDVGFRMTIPCAGFAPGQLISYHIDVAAEMAYSRVAVRLCQRHSYKSIHPAEKVKDLIRILDSHCEKRDRLIITTKQMIAGILHIPLAAPINTVDPKCLIQVGYFLEAVLINKQHKVLHKLSLPITIGTIPLQTSPLVGEQHAKYCYDNLASEYCWGEVSLRSVEPEEHEARELVVWTEPEATERSPLQPFKARHYIQNLTEYFCKTIPL